MFLFMIILYIGLKALLSLEVPYAAFEKDTFPAAQKKQQWFGAEVFLIFWVYMRFPFKFGWWPFLCIVWYTITCMKPFNCLSFFGPNISHFYGLRQQQITGQQPPGSNRRSTILTDLLCDIYYFGCFLHFIYGFLFDVWVRLILSCSHILIPLLCWLYLITSQWLSISICLGLNPAWIVLLSCLVSTHVYAQPVRLIWVAPFSFVFCAFSSWLPSTWWFERLQKIVVCLSASHLFLSDKQC